MCPEGKDGAIGRTHDAVICPSRDLHDLHICRKCQLQMTRDARGLIPHLLWSDTTLHIANPQLAVAIRTEREDLTIGGEKNRVVIAAADRRNLQVQLWIWEIVVCTPSYRSAP